MPAPNGHGPIPGRSMTERFSVSGAGATGLTQFLPSEYYKHGVDFDGDGRIDIWHSVPDALASAAQQLVNKGWQSGVRWAYEVQAPAKVDCTVGVPEVTKPIGQWLREGFVPVRGQKLSAAEQAQPASLLQLNQCGDRQIQSFRIQGAESFIHEQGFQVNAPGAGLHDIRQSQCERKRGQEGFTA